MNFVDSCCSCLKFPDVQVHRSRKLFGSRYALTCCRSLLAGWPARHCRLFFKTRPFFTLFHFIKGSMKLVSGMHHHKYNGMNFFLSMVYLARIFFLSSLISYPRFSNFFFQNIHFHRWLHRL